VGCQRSAVGFQLSAGSDQRLTFALGWNTFWFCGFKNGHLDSFYTIDFLKKSYYFQIPLAK